MEKKPNQQRLKICIVGPSKRFFSGITTHTIFLANALSKTNDVSVILFRKLLPKFLFPGRNRVGKHKSTIGFLPGIDVFDGMDYHSPLTWYRAYKFLKKHKPDVIIMLWWSSTVAHMQLIIKALNNTKIKAKIILEMHEIIDPLEEEILPLKIYLRLIEKILMRNLDAYTTQSDFDKKLVASTYQIDKNRIYAIPVGLYEDYCKPIDKNIAKKQLGVRGEFVILNFGLIRKYKGVPYLIDAFNSLPEKIAIQSKLLIVGEIWDTELNLGEKVNTSKYTSKIRFVSRYISDDEIPLYFSAADVIVLPYLRASGSGIAHIAMMYGNPIIVSETGGLKESMVDYKGSIFVPPGDSNAIANAIVKVYTQDKDTEYKLPNRGWDEIARKYEKLIEAII